MIYKRRSRSEKHVFGKKCANRKKKCFFFLLYFSGRSQFSFEKNTMNSNESQDINTSFWRLFWKQKGKKSLNPYIWSHFGCDQNMLAENSPFPDGFLTAFGFCFYIFFCIKETFSRHFWIVSRHIQAFRTAPLKEAISFLAILSRIFPR